MSAYANLDPGHTTVLNAPVEIDSVLYDTWVANSNPKAAHYLPITVTNQPVFNPNTQQVVQNGWAIFSDRVEPVWVIQSLDASTVFAKAAQTEYQNVLAGNAVTALTAADNNWGSLTALQKDNALRLVVRINKAILKSQYGVQS